jgi:hypothetical protein
MRPPLRLTVLSGVTMKITFFWDGCCLNCQAAVFCKKLLPLSTLKMQAAGSFETFIGINQITYCCIHIVNTHTGCTPIILKLHTVMSQKKVIFIMLAVWLRGEKLAACYCISTDTILHIVAYLLKA